MKMGGFFRTNAFRRILLTVMLLCCAQTAMLSVPAAWAEATEMPELRAEVAAEPDVLISPGEISLTFVLTNASESAMDNVSLTSADGMNTQNLGSLEPGGVHTLEVRHVVSDSELDMGAVMYVATCHADGNLYSYPLEAVINRKIVPPEIEFTRQFSNAYVAAEGSVAVLYEVRNVGEVDILSLTLTDPLGGFSTQAESLEAGESQTFLQRISLAEDTVSAPVLEYAIDAEHENVYTTRLDEAVVRIAYSLLDLDFSAECSPFESSAADVVLELNNNGNVAYRNVTIYDDVYGGVIADSLEIPAGGEPVICTHTYPLRGTEEYRWRVTGETEAGERVDFITDTLELTAAEPDAPARLALSAQASMTNISRKGYVDFTLNVVNEGGDHAAHVQLSEETRGEIRELAVVPAGEPIALQVRYPVYEDSEFAFSAMYTDSDGIQHKIVADPVSVEISAGGQRPEPLESDRGLFSGVSVQVGNSSLFMVLLIGSIIILIVLTIILLVTSRRAKKARRERAAARRQRLKEEMGKTNRFKPVKRTSKK